MAVESERASSLIQFLGMRAFQIVASIEDAYHRERVFSAIAVCADALAVIDAVDLSPHELADLETPNVAAWVALAPDVRNVLLKVRAALDHLAEVFPPRREALEDNDAGGVDDVFALLSSDPSDDWARRAKKVDEVVQQRATESANDVCDGIHTLSSVLQNDTIALGSKLRNPRVVGDRWLLLAELHDFLNSCAQCLEALVAVILGSLTSQHLEEVLPRYLDASTRSVKLRSAVVDLSRDVDQFAPGISIAAGEELAILKAGLAERLTAFSNSPEIRFLRPQDKRAIIFFRIFLNGWEKKGSDPELLRQELEGFSKFLVLMRDLNWRDATAESDRWYLGNARAALESEMDLYLVRPYLEKVYGRSGELDEHVRSLRRGDEPPRAALLRAVVEAEAGLPRV